MFKKIKKEINSWFERPVMVIRPSPPYPYLAKELTEEDRKAFLETFKKKRDEDA